jgi:hypothetical protein|tara:strand:- start:306 stop:1118 length:813 start_codon:yes stop_codon:yes gene_type:complete
MNSIDLNLVFDEGPIARAYIETLERKKISINNLIYLGTSSIFPKNFKIQFRYKLINYKPLKYLRDREVRNFVSLVEKCFELEDNFLIDMYAAKDIKKICKKFIFCKDPDINSDKCCNLISNIPSNIFLNTGKQIYKKILEIGKQFIHIHPAYLPDIRGADGSLWMIKKYNTFAVSSFIMEKEIDKGKIISREKIKLKPLNCLSNKFSTKELYEIWFSFVDPAIRAHHLNTLLRKKNFLAEEKITEKNGNYYSFMDKNHKKEIFKNILIKK